MLLKPSKVSSPSVNRLPPDYQTVLPLYTNPQNKTLIATKRKTDQLYVFKAAQVCLRLFTSSKNLSFKPDIMSIKLLLERHQFSQVTLVTRNNIMYNVHSVLQEYYINYLQCT